MNKVRAARAAVGRGWHYTNALKGQRDALVALRNIGTALLRATTFDAVIDVIAEQVGVLVPHDGGFLLIRPQPGQPLQIRVFPPIILPPIDDERLAVSGGLVASVLADGQLRIGHGPAESGLAWWEREIVAEEQSLLCVPLLIEQQCAGVLTLRAPVGVRYGEDDELLLLTLAAPLGLAIERAQQHATLLRLAQTAKRAGMQRLTHAIGHELRNPLQGLHGSLHLLDNPALPAPRRDLVLYKAQEEVERLITTVQRMLECYHPAHTDMRPVAMPKLIERVLALAAAQIQAQGVVAEYVWDDPLPHVRGVEGHLKQALLALVLNAIEAMPKGGRLLIRACAAERPSDGTQMVQIDVTDSGAGIAREHLPTVFEPFYTTKENQPGLGLAISYGIIEHHAGSLVVSTDAAGTTCSVTLPAY